jgi:cation transport ATPase
MVCAWLLPDDRASVATAAILGVAAWAVSLGVARRLDSHTDGGASPDAAPGRLARTVGEAGALAGLPLGAVAAWLGGAPLGEALLAGGLMSAALANVAVSAVVRAGVRGAAARATRGGVRYRDGESFDRAAAADRVVLLSHGALFEASPRLLAVEPAGDASEAGALTGLALAALRAWDHPAAVALANALPEGACVSPALKPLANLAASPADLGFRAVTAKGEHVTLGTRTFVVEQGASVAAADARISELEAEGRTVLVLVQDGRARGIVVLLETPRAGARAAVQALLDARIEPVLVTGLPRATAEVLARALDIEHVRADVCRADLPEQVRALGAGVHRVAFVGHPVADAPMLEAAHVALVVGTEGERRWDVRLTDGDLRVAALALTAARAARDEARLSFGLSIAPPIAALVALAAGAPLAVASFSLLAGALVALARGGAPTS